MLAKCNHTSGNGVATAQLFENYGDAVRRWAAKMGNNTAEADDIVQDVFLVVHKHAEDVPGIRNPAPWLFRITANVVRHRIRDRYRRIQSNDFDIEHVVDESPSPFENVERRRQLKRLANAMSALAEADQQLLWLCDVRDLPTSQVIAMTGIKPQTLRVRRFRARSRIARRLRDCE